MRARFCSCHTQNTQRSLPPLGPCTSNVQNEFTYPKLDPEFIFHCQQIGHHQSKAPSIFKVRFFMRRAHEKQGLSRDNCLLPAPACQQVLTVCSLFFVFQTNPLKFEGCCIQRGVRARRMCSDWYLSEYWCFVIRVEAVFTSCGQLIAF